MNNVEREKSKTTEEGGDPLAGVEDKAAIEPSVQPGLYQRVWKLIKPRQHGSGTKQEMAKDRTRSMALLIGGSVGVLLLFVGVFSTPTTQPVHETGGQTGQNLGRRSAPSQLPTAPRTSVTPLLNADVPSGDANSNQLRPADIQGTSRRTLVEPIPDAREGSAEARGGQEQIPQARASGLHRLPSTAISGLAARRSSNNTGVPTYSYGAPVSSSPGGELPRTYSYGGAAVVPTANRLENGLSSKSSIVFVRSSPSTEFSPKPRTSVTTSPEQTSLLPAGTQMIARLEAAATTAVKTPVVASIEYNYERDGLIVVPAGAKVLGDVQQASSQGYLNVRFHTLQMPDGEEERIEASGLGLDQKPLKGEVSGKNTGRKLVSRTFSGVGTIAAYVVGAGGAGLTRTVTGETLLRDRVASNVALAGEQELMNAAYSQNISVTVPANTRFYVVLQKPALNATAPAPAQNAYGIPQTSEIPTVQELRDLMELKREINRMYQESNNSQASGGPRP